MDTVQENINQCVRASSKCVKLLLIVGVMRHKVKEKKINVSSGLNKERRTVKRKRRRSENRENERTVKKKRRRRGSEQVEDKLVCVRN